MIKVNVNPITNTPDDNVWRTIKSFMMSEHPYSPKIMWRSYKCTIRNRIVFFFSKVNLTWIAYGDQHQLDTRPGTIFYIDGDGLIGYCGTWWPSRLTVDDLEVFNYHESLFYDLVPAYISAWEEAPFAEQLALLSHIVYPQDVELMKQQRFKALVDAQKDTYDLN